MGVTRTNEVVPLAAPRAAQPEEGGSVAALFERYERDLGRFLVQLVGSASLAEDLLQETFVDVLRAGDRLGGVENQRAWLYAVARNRALGALRRERRYRRAVTRLVEPLLRTTRDTAEAASVRDLLERALAPEDRALVLLRYGHGFTSRDLAEVMGLSPEAVRQRLSRARARVLEEADQPEREART